MDQAASATLVAGSSVSASGTENLVLHASLSAGSSFTAASGIPDHVRAALLAGSTFSVVAPIITSKPKAPQPLPAEPSMGPPLRQLPSPAFRPSLTITSRKNG